MLSTRAQCRWLAVRHGESKGGSDQCTSNADRPDPGSVELDAEREAARRAREPLGPATREAPERPADIEAVKRLIDPTRRRRPRNGDPSKQGYDENDHLSAYD